MFSSYPQRGYLLVLHLNILRWAAISVHVLTLPLTYNVYPLLTELAISRLGKHHDLS